MGTVKNLPRSQERPRDSFASQRGATFALVSSRRASFQLAAPQLKLTRRGAADTVIATKLATRVTKQSSVSPSFQASE